MKLNTKVFGQRETLESRTREPSPESHKFSCGIMIVDSSERTETARSLLGHPLASSLTVTFIHDFSHIYMPVHNSFKMSITMSDVCAEQVCNWIYYGESL